MNRNQQKGAVCCADVCNLLNPGTMSFFPALFLRDWLPMLEQEAPADHGLCTQGNNDNLCSTPIVVLQKQSRWVPRLPIHPIFYHFPSSCLSARNHVRHKHFKMELESLKLSAELSQMVLALSCPKNENEKRKGTRQMYGTAYMQPQPTGVTVNLKDFPVLSQHTRYIGKSFHLRLTLVNFS